MAFNASSAPRVLFWSSCNVLQRLRGLGTCGSNGLVKFVPPSRRTHRAVARPGLCRFDAFLAGEKWTRSRSELRSKSKTGGCPRPIGSKSVTGRYYRGRYVAKLEPLCNRHALNHGYAFVTSPCVVYFSTAHRQQQALFAQWSLYLPHRRYLPDLHLGALDVQLPGLVDAR